MLEIYDVSFVICLTTRAMSCNCSGHATAKHQRCRRLAQYICTGTMHAIRALALCAAAATAASVVQAFAPQIDSSFRLATTELAFGIPSFLSPKSDDDSGKKKVPGSEEKKVGFKGLLQLIAAGAGAPFLGDYQGIDKETGNFMFSLEANNLVDEDGKSKQTAMPYFENGWVDPEDEAKAAKRKGEGFEFPWQK